MYYILLQLIFNACFVNTIPSRMFIFSIRNNRITFLYLCIICDQIFGNYGQLRSPQVTLGHLAAETPTRDLQRYNQCDLDFREEE